MEKKTYSNINLVCTFQKSEGFQESKCLNGVMSRIPEGFRFEEAVKERHPRRNPKLFDGNY